MLDLSLVLKSFRSDLCNGDLRKILENKWRLQKSSQRALRKLYRSFYKIRTFRCAKLIRVVILINFPFNFIIMELYIIIE